MEDADLMDTAGAKLRLDLMVTGVGAGIDMTDYWGYLKKNAWQGPAAFIKSAYDVAYDNAHGSSKYWLSKVPIYGQMRKYQDEAQSAQDQYDKTGKDPVYSTTYGNSNPAAAVGGMVGGAAGAAKMARSLVDVYSSEIVEDVSKKFNNSYW